MPALGVHPLPSDARVQTARRWRRECNDSADEDRRSGTVNLDQVHYLQHVAVNLLYAMRTCDAFVQPTPSSNRGTDRGTYTSPSPE